MSAPGRPPAQAPPDRGAGTFRQPTRPWIVVACILALMLIGAVLFVQHHGRKAYQEAGAAAQRELDLLASLIQTHLEGGHYQGASQAIQAWGEKEAGVIRLSLLAGNGFSLGEYRRPAVSERSLRLEAAIPYAYRNTARLILVTDLAPIERKAHALALQVGGAYLFLALLLITLTRLMLLYRGEAAALRARTAELAQALGRRDAAEAERDRLISVLEAATDLVCMIEPNGNLLYINQAGRRMTGLGDLAAANLPIAQLHPPWAYDLIVQQGIPAAIRTGAWSGETALLGPDGGETPVSQVILGHRDAQGRLEYLSTIMRDITERKRVETELRHFKDTLDRIQEGVFMFDAESLKFRYVNQGAMAQVGYSEAELLDMTPLDIKPEYDAASFRTLIAPLCSGERSTLRFQTLHRHRDGHDVPVEIFLQYVETPGEAPRFVAIVVDISQRRRSEAALRASEAQLEEAQAIAHLGSWDLDLGTGKANWSREEYRLLGYAPDAIEAGVDAFLARVHPEDRDRVWAEMQAAMTRETGHYQVEHRVALPDGTERIVLEQGRVIFDDARRPLRMVGSTLDVTETRRAERELEAHRHRLEELVAARTRQVRDQAAIIDQIHDAVISTDLDGSITGWNLGAERLYGYSSEEALGRHIGMLYFDRETLQRDIIQPLREQGAHEIELRLRRKDGSAFDALLSLSMRLDGQGRPIGMIGYSLDISARKQAQRLLQQRSDELAAANRELEAFAYSVSHDLRAPLRAIDGFSQALLEDYGERMDEIGRDYLRRVRTAAQRMAALIDDLLELSRVSRSRLQPAAVDLSRMAEEILAALQEQQPERRVAIAIQSGLQAWGDPGLLRTAMENLLGNAWKYTGRTAEARIEVGSEQTQTGPVFYVRDNGAGFDMRYADKLFGAFQRLHHPSEFEGTGIGLATVQRIIHRHGGRVWAQSSPGEGATFLFTLGGGHDLPNAPLSEQNSGNAGEREGPT
jgi:PAS domain S-box-containing protein